MQLDSEVIEIYKLITLLCNKEDSDLFNKFNSNNEYKLRLYDECLFLKNNKLIKQNIIDIYKNKKQIGNNNKTNSIIAFLLKITNKEPDLSKSFEFRKKYKLTRVSPPDIDIDFEEREPVFKYLLNKYGEDRTCFISTYNIIKARSAVQFAFKMNGITEGDLDPDKFSKFISKKIKFRSESFDDAISVRDLDEYRTRYKEIFEQAKKIYGVRLHAGVHPAGIIIADKDLVNYVPVRKIGDQYAIEYDKDDLENLGLLKNDILKLSTLKQMHNVVKCLKKTRNINIDINLIKDQPDVYDIFRKCEVNGIFQMESMEMQNILKMVKPTNFNDIVACNALVRPGPNEAGYPKMYGDRKSNNRLITYYHESIKDVLKHTYGLILYQEQVMSICRILAGFSATEADKVRKFIGKKQTDQKKVDEIRNMFTGGCAKIGYISEKEANNLWNIIQDFGKYAFNESHSVAYAMVSYQTAWLKYHYYLEFMACLLSITLDENAKSEDVLPKYIRELHQKGIIVKNPTVNLSRDYFYIKDEKTIVKPFHYIKGIGRNIGALIYKNQPYKNFEDFLDKNNNNPISSDVMELLINNKCFSDFQEDMDNLRERYNVHMQIRKKERTKTSKIKDTIQKNKSNFPGFGKIKEHESFNYTQKGLL